MAETESSILNFLGSAGDSTVKIEKDESNAVLRAEFEKAILDSTKRDTEREKALQSALNTLRKQREKYMKKEAGSGNDDVFNNEKEPEEEEAQNEKEKTEFEHPVDNESESAENMTKRLYFQALDLKERSDNQDPNLKDNHFNSVNNGSMNYNVEVDEANTYNGNNTSAWNPTQSNYSPTINHQNSQQPQSMVSKKELFKKSSTTRIGDDLYRRAQLREQRLRQRQEIAANQAKAKAQPQLNKRSLEMAERLETSAMDRLINYQKREVIIENDILAESTFHPEINEVSKNICAGKVSGGVSSHERLYEQSKLMRERKERLHESRIDIEMADCTFNPNTRSSSKTFRTTMGSVNLRSNDHNVVSRLQDWGKRREERIEKEQSMKVDKNEIECTFKPQLDSNKPLCVRQRKSIKHVERSQHPGISKFIERQQIARDLKKERESVPYCTGQKWTGRTTKGIAPKFNNRPSSTKIRSLRRPVPIQKESPQLPKNNNNNHRNANHNSESDETKPFKEPPTVTEIEHIIFVKLEEYMSSKRTVLNDLFHEFDQTRKGYLTREEYGLLMCRLGVDTIIGNNVEPFIEYLQEVSPNGRITYHYLVSELRNHRTREIKAQHTTPSKDWPPINTSGDPTHMRDMLSAEVAKLVEDEFDERESDMPNDDNDLVFMPSEIGKKHNNSLLPTSASFSKPSFGNHHHKNRNNSMNNLAAVDHSSGHVINPNGNIKSMKFQHEDNDFAYPDATSEYSPRANADDSNKKSKNFSESYLKNSPSAKAVTKRGFSEGNTRKTQHQKSLSAHYERMRRVRQQRHEEEIRQQMF
eukprot:TRINITY_DN490_c0_g4_i1.p1 TRINITY_DN490_c0_g4~~TRINITY_DN490_c0_g4_i1.p1  ORF type:complete len:814 (-),score=249.87 TRINITY_DN490_c0_g4_i1:99-2540(-)